MESSNKKTKPSKGVLSIFKTLKQSSLLKNPASQVQDCKRTQTPLQINQKIQPVKRKKVDSRKQPTTFTVKQKPSSPRNRTPYTTTNPKPHFPQRSPQLAQPTFQTSKNPKHPKTNSQNKLKVPKKRTSHKNQEKQNHKKQKNAQIQNKKIRKTSSIKSFNKPKIKKSPFQLQQKLLKPSQSKPSKITRTEKPTKLQRLSQKPHQKQRDISILKLGIKAKHTKIQTSKPSKPKKTKSQIYKAETQLKEVIRKNKRLQALLQIAHQQNRVLLQFRQPKKPLYKPKSPIMTTLQILSSKGEQSFQVTKWKFQSQSDLQELPQSQLVQQFRRSLQQQGPYQQLLQTCQKNLKYQADIPQLTPQSGPRGLRVPLLQLSKIKAFQSNPQRDLPNSTFLIDQNLQDKFREIQVEEMDCPISDSSTSILSVVDFSDQSSSSKEIEFPVKSFREFDERRIEYYNSPRSIEIENQAIVAQILDMEINKFIGKIDYQIDSGEVDPSVEFTQVYCQKLKEIFQEFEGEILAKINRPLERDPLEILEEVQNTEIGKLNKFYTLDLILCKKRVQKLHQMLNTRECYSRVCYLQMIFDCVNQALNFIRPFIINGKPLLWSRKSQIFRKYQRIQEVYQRVLQSLFDWQLVNQNSILLFKEYQFTVEQEKRVANILLDETRKGQFQWRSYQDEELQVNCDIAELVFDFLLEETSNLNKEFFY